MNMFLRQIVERLPLLLDIITAQFKESSRHRLPYNDKERKGIINILGTGPSLKNSIDTLMLNDGRIPGFALNDFAVSELYTIIKPQYYILLDPAYFIPEQYISQKEIKNRTSVFNRINKETSWNMEIIIPSKFYKSKQLNTIFSNTKVKIKPVCFAELALIDCRTYYKTLEKNIAGSFQNVMGAAIYISINMGFKEIRLFGAEHSWTKDMRVNKKNQVCTIYRHFYEEEDQLVPWLNFNNKNFSMDEILFALHKTFLGYKLLAKYAAMKSCRVYNYTPETFIDAFGRKELLKK